MDPLLSSTNKTDSHDVNGILLKAKMKERKTKCDTFLEIFKHYEFS
jgi:hypothetical protein